MRDRGLGFPLRRQGASVSGADGYVSVPCRSRCSSSRSRPFGSHRRCVRTWHDGRQDFPAEHRKQGLLVRYTRVARARGGRKALRHRSGVMQGDTKGEGGPFCSKITLLVLRAHTTPSTDWTGPVCLRVAVPESISGQAATTEHQKQAAHIVEAYPPPDHRLLSPKNPPHLEKALGLEKVGAAPLQRFEVDVSRHDLATFLSQEELRRPFFSSGGGFGCW